MNKVRQSLVSIIILNYNAGQLLLDCVESILKTTYDNFEIIIVDNASMDESHRKCKAKFEDICTEIWLVKCPKEIQKNRLITRDKISEKEAYELINFQLSFEEKRKFSDIILDNSDDQNKWINTIKELL